MIHIIGGGLGGLALAQGLARSGVPCRVYERDDGPDSRTQGYRISLDALGRHALEQLLPEDRYERVLALECRDVGRGFAFATVPERPLLRLDADAWTIRRPALREILAEDVEIVWSRRVEGLDGLPAGDLVVGADGVHSSVREALRATAPVPTVIDTGVRVVGGLVPRTAAWDERLPLNRDGAVSYLGPRGQAMFVSCCERQDGTPLILWALSQRGEYPEPDSAWHPTLSALMQDGERARERFPIHSTRIVVPKHRLHPNVTLLGDAAHAMPPQRGLGGNNAFEDARRLCARLDDLAGYEREMFTRGKRAVNESEEATDLLHLRNAGARALRNAALGTVGRVRQWWAA